MIKAFICSVLIFLVIILVLICVVYWFFNYATLDKLGYADAVISEVEQPDGTIVEVTPRSIGIADMTFKEILDWFEQKVNDSKKK